MKNSLKQMMRTPVRTVCFLVLVVFAALLMTLGTCVWLKGYKTMAQYEDRFMTVGTVRADEGCHFLFPDSQRKH